MNIETTFTWERSPGEEIELAIGGEYQPSQILNEHEGFVNETITLDWIENPNHILSPGVFLDKCNFQPREIEAMESALLKAARQQHTPKNKPQFSGLRAMLDLPEFKPTKPFVI